MTFPFLILFSTNLIFSTLFICSASNWILVWAALELNLLSFIPLMTLSSSFQETESSVKYFLAQVIGSSILLASMIYSATKEHQPSHLEKAITALMMMGLILKLGLAPMHFWFPPMLTGLSWPLVVIATTWQKLGPILILSAMLFPAPMKSLLLLSSFSTLVGGISGLNQTKLRTILAYSSIGHMGWLAAGASLSPQMMLSYFSAYTILTTPIMLIFWKTNATTTKFTSNQLNTSLLKPVGLLLLSLGGLPPLLGFFPKWLVISTLAGLEVWTPLFLMISGSLMNIFYYLTLILAMFYTSTFSSQTKMFSSDKSKLSPLTLTALLLTTLAPLLYTTL